MNINLPDDLVAAYKGRLEHEKIARENAWVCAIAIRQKVDDLLKELPADIGTAAAYAAFHKVMHDDPGMKAASRLTKKVLADLMSVVQSSIKFDTAL